MRNLLAKLAFIILLVLNTANVFASTDIIGTVTARHGDSLKVEFQRHEAAAPKTGDKVEFSLQLDGLPVGAGAGKVTQVDGNAVWVQISDGQPDLKMDAVIHATVKHDNVPPLHRCDELAGDPNDDQRIGPAVETSSIDIDQAMTACKNAINEYPKTARFLYQLARVYDTNKQHKEAFEYFQKAADENYIIAAHILGDMYKWGYGTKKKNYVKAVDWYKKAALQGDVLAQYTLGQIYTAGNGITIDYVEAAKWYRQSAMQGFPIAQYKLGEMYASGKGVEMNYEKAVKWYKKAASKGHKESQDRLNKYIKIKQIKAFSDDTELIDFNNPLQVAEAYWKAMIEKDYTKAEIYIFQKYREKYKLSDVVDGMKALPPFPEHPRVRVEVDGNEGITIIENWEYDDGPEMLFRKGRWWIGR